MKFLEYLEDDDIVEEKKVNEKDLPAPIAFLTSVSLEDTPPKKIYKKKETRFKNIDQVDHYIRSIFKQESDKKTQALLEIDKQLLKDPHSIELKNKKYTLARSGNNSLSEYENSVERIIQNYRDVLGIYKKHAFLNNDIRISTSRDLRKLTNEYVIQTQKFIDFSITYLSDTQDSSICVCGSIDFIETEDDIRICTDCFEEINTMALKLSFRDSKRVSLVSHNNHSRESYFKAGILRFQGKQNNVIKQQVYDDIYDEMEKYGILPENVTKRFIFKALEQTKNGGSYAHINLIYYTITKTTPPDISHLEKKLYQLNKEFEEEFEKIKNKRRSSALNVNYKLMKFLQLLDYPIESDDILGLKTYIKVDEHDIIASEIFERKGWTFIWSN